MPFNSTIGSTFNCGFCRTAVYEYLAGKREDIQKSKDSQSKESASVDSQLHCNTSVNEVVGEKSINSKVCVSEHFRTLFCGPQFEVGGGYFDKGKSSRESKFERHCDKVQKAFSGFRTAYCKERYLKNFSSVKWKALPPLKKAAHSLSNCVACASEFADLQMGFPMKPFFCPPESENECVQNTCAKCLQPPNKALQELAANLGYKSPAQVKQIQKAAEKKGFCEGQRKCITEVSSQLKSSALQAAYSTDVSVSKFEKLRKAQYFNSPSVTSLQKKRYALRPHECGKFDELCQLLKDWEPSNTFVASELAKTFDVTCTDSSHKIKLLAQDVNPTIPGLEIVPKRKSTRVKLKGSDLSLPVPPSKKRLVEIDRSLVESGVLNEGVPCVPVSLVRFHKGVKVEIVAQSRKFPLKDIRQSLLDAHEPFMRLHKDCEIDKMNKEDILNILERGSCFSMKQFEEATLGQLKCFLTKFERNRMIWIWHDHSCLASHGIVAVMIGVVYDPIVFKTESEVGQSVQEFVEEGEIHIVAHGSSTLADQATLIPERLAELDGLTDEVTSNSGIKIVDTVRFFKGDKPAAEFEAGVCTGGNYPCVGCACHHNRFADYPHAVKCEQRSLERIQEVALAGHFGGVPGKMRFYDELSSNQLRMELEKRAIKDYPSDKKGRLAALKGVLCGVQRVPSLLMFAPEACLSDLYLSSYCVLPCEPLHDLKGYLAAVLRMLPSILPSSALKGCVCEYLDTLWKKPNLYGSDLREALVEVAFIFASHPAQGPVFDYITCLVQVSGILYSQDSDRSPKQCLQFYNCAYKVHELHCALFGEVHTSLYFHALLVHGPVQHEVVCCRSTNTENEERIFKSAESAAKCTDRKPENMLPSVLKRLQCKRKSKINNPIQSLKQANSRIALSAKKLPPFKGTVFKADFVKKRVHSYQAHLQRIGHFLVQGEGVWWHKESDGSFHFHDGSDYAVFSNAGPQLLHFRNAQLDDVLRHSNACWHEALEKKISLPIEVVRHYNSCGYVSEIAVTDKPTVSSSPEVSSDGSFVIPSLPPPVCLTPLSQNDVPEAASSEANEQPDSKHC